MKKQLSKLLCGSILVASFLTPTAQAASDPLLGEIMWVGFTFCPRGWAEANGQLLPISQNSALFSLYGTTYGGDGRTTFALPDLRGRTPVHAGQGPGLSQLNLGVRFGAERTTQVPAHTHQLGANATATLKANANTDALANNVASPADAVLADGQRAAVYSPVPAAPAELSNMNSSSVALSGSTQPAGSTSVDIRQPSLVIRACIATQGVFPSRN